MHVAYNVAKAGVNHITRHIANNYGVKGIRSNAVMPGLLMGETQERQNDQQMQQMFLIAAKVTRLGGPSDLAAVTAFVLSDEADWINGQTWYIGGACTCGSSRVRCTRFRLISVTTRPRRWTSTLRSTSMPASAGVQPLAM